MPIWHYCHSCTISKKLLVTTIRQFNWIFGSVNRRQAWDQSESNASMFQSSLSSFPLIRTNWHTYWQYKLSYVVLKIDFRQKVISSGIRPGGPLVSIQCSAPWANHVLVRLTWFMHLFINFIDSLKFLMPTLKTLYITGRLISEWTVSI